MFGVAFSIIGLLPSIASVLLYAIPSGAGPSMVWGVSISFKVLLPIANALHKWAVASLFILCVGMSMAELASAAPTSGGVRTF